MLGLPPFWSGNAIPHAIAPSRRSEHYGYGCPAGVSRRDLESSPDALGALGHDGQAVTTVRAGVGKSLAVVGNLDLLVRRGDRGGAPHARSARGPVRGGDSLPGGAHHV